MKANKIAWLFGVPLTVFVLSLGVMPNTAKALVVDDTARFGQLEVDNYLNVDRLNEPGNTGYSVLFDDWDFHIATDDVLYLDAPHSVRVQHNLDVDGKISINRLGDRNNVVGSFIYDDWHLHIATDDYLHLDAPKQVIVKNGLKVKGDLMVQGTATFEDLDLNGTVDISGANFQGHFLPSADSTYDLGSSTKKWRDLYLSGNTINLEDGGATITFDGTNDALELDGASIAVGDDPGGSSTSSATDGDLWVESGLKLGNGTTPNDFTQFSDGSLFVTGQAEFDGSVRFDGTTDFNDALDVSAAGATITGNLVPSSSATYSLGSSSAEWASLYLGDDDSGGVIFGLDQDVTAGWDNTAAALQIVGGLVAIGADPGGATATGAGDLIVSGDFEVDGTADFDGAINVSDATVTGHLIPSADSTYDLGSSGAKWRDLYLSGNTINLESGAATISYDTTATALELKNALVSIGEAAGASFVSGAGDLLVTGGFEVLGGVSLNSGATIFGGLTDIGVGTYSLADGNNDIGVDGDLEVNGTSQFDGLVTIGDGGDTVAIDSSDWDISTTGVITGIAFDANGTGNSLSNVENADLADDTLDFDKFADAMALDAATSVTGGSGEVLSIIRTLTDSTDENGVVMTFTASDSGSGSTSQYGLVLDNAASTEGLDASLVVSNSDADDPVAAAFKITDAGGGFTNIFDNAGILISGAELNLIDAGVTLGELTDSGTLTATTVDINGGAIDGTTIGATVTASGAFTTLAASGDVDLSATGGSVGDPDLGVPGYALFTGTLDINGAADFSGGLTNSAGELLVSGGNVQVNDDLVLSFGSDDDTTLSYDETTDDAFEIAGSALVSIGDDPGTSTTATGAGDLLVSGDFETDGASQFDGDSTFNARVNLGAQSLVIADNGGGTNAVDTLTPTSSLVRVTCSDADGCDVTMGEGSASDGDLVVIVHDGAVDSNYSDTDGVSNLTAAMAAGDDDVLVMVYDVDEWVEVSRADN